MSTGVIRVTEEEVRAELAQKLDAASLTLADYYELCEASRCGACCAPDGVPEGVWSSIGTLLFLLHEEFVRA